MNTARAENWSPPTATVLNSRNGKRPVSPQALAVLTHLELTRSISNVEAHAVLKCRSVSRRITELQDAGYTIRKEHKRDSQDQRYVRYFLDS